MATPLALQALADAVEVVEKMNAQQSQELADLELVKRGAMAILEEADMLKRQHTHIIEASNGYLERALIAEANLKAVLEAMDEATRKNNEH